jgi:DNA polymerase-3 subunit alpha
MPVTQFNMKWVEQAGLVKFDFLGLKTLTVLDRRSPPRRRASPSISTRCRWDDRRPTSCWQRGDTVGVFQLESEGMRDVLRK